MTLDRSEKRLVTLVIAVVGVLLVLPPLLMGFVMMVYGPVMGGMWGGGMWGDGTATGWMLVGTVTRLLFLAAIVGGGYLVYRTVAGNAGDSDQALEELRLAYARGELTDEEYEQRRDALERDA